MHSPPSAGTETLPSRKTWGHVVGWCLAGILLVASLPLVSYNVWAFLLGETGIGRCSLDACSPPTEVTRKWAAAWRASGAGLVLVALISTATAVRGYGRPVAIAAAVITGLPALVFIWLVSGMG